MSGYVFSATSGRIGKLVASPPVKSLRDQLVNYAMHYGPRCRDCADEADICPTSGIPCEGRRKATEFVVDALIYGAEHGYCPSALVRGETL